MLLSLSRALLSWIVPLVTTLIVMRTLVPARIDAGARGPLAWLARAADDHPLLVALVLFLVLAEALGYWLRRAGVLQPSRATPPRRLAGALVVLALAGVALLVRARVADVYRVTGVSMLPTLVDGDRVLVNKRAYARAGDGGPGRGDVIVFRDRRADGGGPARLVKRVIGVAGDVVAFNSGSAIINGWVVPSCDAGPFFATLGTLSVRGRVAVEFVDDRAYLTVRTPLDDATFPAYEVPAGEVFVIGDDRSLSSDSRGFNAGHGGGIPLGDVEGRVSRLAVGGRQGGGLDLGRLLAPLGLVVREPAADVRGTSERIAACLANPPRATTPPRPGDAHKK